MSSGSTEVAQKQGPRSRCCGWLGWHWARSNVSLGLDVSCRQREWGAGVGGLQSALMLSLWKFRSQAAGHRLHSPGTGPTEWRPPGHHGRDASGPACACALL